jgi:ATP-binding cassette subfamily B protein
LFAPIITLLIGLSTVLTIYIGSRQAILGEISVGTIAEFVVYVNMLTWPFATVGWVSSLIQRASASQQRINEFLNETPEIQNKVTEQHELQGKIEFRNVSFTYPESGIKALQNVSFSIEPGQTLAIIGKTGSGKSTVSTLVARLFDATSGDVLIDSTRIDQINLDKLRSSIGYVPQDVFLFSDTIANNISFGLKDNITRERIEQAAKDAVIYDNIMEFKEGFETVVGERGVTLSGGQKQRVSIARAIIREPKILIFDDCLSAVDTETEDQILKNLRRIMQGRTSILVSHRVSTVRHADKIIVLQNGSIAEEGTHQALIDKKGIYFDLYRKQLLEDEKIV